MLSAFVLIKAQEGLAMKDAAAAHQAAHQVAGVKTVHFVMGRVDAIVYLEVADLNALTDAVGKLRAVKGIGRTETCIVMPI